MQYPKTPIKLTEKKFTRTIKSYPLVVLVCLPNMKLSFGNPIPIIEGMVRKYDGKVILGLMDISENKDFASRYDMDSTPVVMIFKNQRLVSYLKNDLTMRDIEERIQQNI